MAMIRVPDMGYKTEGPPFGSPVIRIIVYLGLFWGNLFMEPPMLWFRYNTGPV